jgi:hypothetical protein
MKLPRPLALILKQVAQMQVRHHYIRARDELEREAIIALRDGEGIEAVTARMHARAAAFARADLQAQVDAIRAKLGR